MLPRLWWRVGEGASLRRKLQDVEVVELARLEGNPKMSGARGDGVGRGASFAAVTSIYEGLE